MPTYKAFRIKLRRSIVSSFIGPSICSRLALQPGQSVFLPDDRVTNDYTKKRFHRMRCISMVIDIKWLCAILEFR